MTIYYIVIPIILLGITLLANSIIRELKAQEVVETKPED